jgi:hypothetical protein
MSVEISSLEAADLGNKHQSNSSRKNNKMQDSPDRNHIMQKLHHLQGMSSSRKEKVQSILAFFDAQCLLVSIILQNELL